MDRMFSMDGCEESRPLTGTGSPDRLALSEFLYLLLYPGQTYTYKPWKPVSFENI
jgi:hypothetical protein